MRKVSVKEAIQDTDISVKVLKENEGFLLDKSIFNLMKVFLHHNSRQVLNL